MRIHHILAGTATVAAAVLFSAPTANAADAPAPEKAQTQLGDINLKIHEKPQLDFMDLHTAGALEATTDKLDIIGGNGADG